VEALYKLMPTRALRQSGGPGGAAEWVEVSPEVLVAGNRIKVLPGESIPVDATVEEGQSAVDQATLTGESLPRSVREGSAVFAGRINIGNPIVGGVTGGAAESSWRGILNLVMEAQRQREPVQRLIDRVSQPYAIGVMGVSLVVFLVWWLAFSDPWRSALYTA